MAIKYPIKDFATAERQAECKNFNRKGFIARVAKDSFHPTEEYEQDYYQPHTDTKIFVLLIAGIFILMSLYLITTQAKADDCNVMPISPMSLVDSWGQE